MAGITLDLRLGSLQINGEAMCRPAWIVTEEGLRMLWGSAALRGDDRVIPTSPGVKSYPRRPTVTPYSLPMIVSGEVDPSGVPCPVDPYVQLEANVTYLRANVGDAYGTGRDANSLVVANLTMPSGAVRTGLIHVVRFTLGAQIGVNAAGVLDVEVPDGVLV